MPTSSGGSTTNLASIAGTAQTALDVVPFWRNAGQALNPSSILTVVTITATTLTDVLNRSGRGKILWIHIEDLDTSAGTDTMRIQIDSAELLNGSTGVGGNWAVTEIAWVNQWISTQAYNALSETLAGYVQSCSLSYNTSILIQASSHATPTSGIRIRILEERYA